MATYSDLPHQCNIEAYKKEMQELQDKCNEMNNQINDQYFKFYRKFVDLCNTDTFTKEDVCCINDQNLLKDYVSDYKKIAEELLDKNKYVTDWITSRGVWYQLDSYWKLRNIALKHISEILNQKAEQEGFDPGKDPDLCSLRTFVDELEHCIRKIELEYPAYAHYSYYFNGGFYIGGGGAGGINLMMDR